MKKVRVNLKRGVKSWSFVLYDSAESAFYLKDEPVYNDSVDEAYRKVVTLLPGETIEVEWIGSEWVYEDENSVGGPRPISCAHEKFDKVRVGKLTPIKSDVYKSGYLEVYSGWLVSNHAPLFQETAQKTIRITPIKGKIRSKFDFSQIFKEQNLDDSEPEEASEDEVEKAGPLVLN